MVDIFFKCASCGKHLVVDDSAAGTKVKCPECNDAVVIPDDGRSQHVSRTVGRN